MNSPRMLFWLGPGIDDRDAWRAVVAAGRGQVLEPERTEALVSGTDDESPTPSVAAGVRGLVCRDGRLAGARVRRHLRSMIGADGFVVQVVREPIAALSAELRRQQAAAMVRRWKSPGNAGSTELHVTARMTAERILPRLAYGRRGQAFTPSRGRRIVLDRDELSDPRSHRLRAPVDDWFARLDARVDWDSIEPGTDGDATEILLGLARGPIDVEGARVPVELLPAADVALRTDRVALARIPSIAARVGFPVENTPLVLTTPGERLAQLPRGLRHALTETGVVQHQLEEDLMPRWIDRAEQIHRELSLEPVVSSSLATKIRRALRTDLDDIFALRPTLRTRWGLMLEQALAS